jgi:hypothetical protein
MSVCVCVSRGQNIRKEESLPKYDFFKSQFILQSVVIHLAECYGEGVLQCLGERPSVGPLCR